MKTILRDILIPVDLSETSLNSLNTAIHMARRHQARLHVLYVSDLLFHYPQMGNLTAVHTMAAEVIEKDKSVLEDLTRSIRTSEQVDCRLYTPAGNRDLLIKEWAQKHPADLVILGMPAHIDHASYIFDSLAYQLLQDTPCHVLAVPAGKSNQVFQHVVYPVQSTAAPMATLPLAKQIIEKNHADVSVVSMIDNADANLQSSLNSLSARIRFRLAKNAASVTTSQVYTQNAAASLVAICKAELADLVVIGANTRRNIREYFFGNFTQKMLHNPETAVLCINPAQKERVNKASVSKLSAKRMQLA